VQKDIINHQTEKQTNEVSAAAESSNETCRIADDDRNIMT
jgi:hypothetical protein